MIKSLVRVCTLAFALAALLSQPTQAAEAQREPLVVFAAASLTDVLQQAGPAYTQQSKVPVKFYIILIIGRPVTMSS